MCDVFPIVGSANSSISVKADVELFYSNPSLKYLTALTSPLLSDTIQSLEVSFEINKRKKLNCIKSTEP